MPKWDIRRGTRGSGRVSPLPEPHLCIHSASEEKGLIMDQNQSPIFYTYDEAARRVGRSKRALQRWHRKGMPMHVDHQGRKIVDEAILVAWYRHNLKTWPPHQYRLRRILAGHETGA